MQAIVTRRNGTLCFLNVVEKGPSSLEPADRQEWHHVKVVFQDDHVAVHLDGNEHPDFEIGAVFDRTEARRVGMCGRDFYFSNFCYTPSG